jgi:hypothetical protein
MFSIKLRAHSVFGRQFADTIVGVSLALQMLNKRIELARQLIGQVRYSFELLFVKIARVPRDAQLRPHFSGRCFGCS